jgi:predicted Zn-dependent protease
LAVQHDSGFEDAQIGLGRVLIALGKPALAVPHLEKAVSLNPKDEVAYYALARAQKELGNRAAQEKALAEFRRLRGERAKRQENALFVPREVTKQELDPDAEK